MLHNDILRRRISPVKRIAEQAQGDEHRQEHGRSLKTRQEWAPPRTWRIAEPAPEDGRRHEHGESPRTRLEMGAAKSMTDAPSTRQKMGVARSASDLAEGA
jgi:hypothetical protein